MWSGCGGSGDRGPALSMPPRHTDCPTPTLQAPRGHHPTIPGTHGLHTWRRGGGLAGVRRRPPHQVLAAEQLAAHPRVHRVAALDAALAAQRQCCRFADLPV